tara:strand:- start:227 stop:448 length:222 start_codon:yes stop_codon:yes gene_type:complete
MFPINLLIGKKKFKNKEMNAKNIHPNIPDSKSFNLPVSFLRNKYWKRIPDDKIIIVDAKEDITRFNIKNTIII